MPYKQCKLKEDAIPTISGPKYLSKNPINSRKLFKKYNNNIHNDDPNF